MVEDTGDDRATQAGRSSSTRMRKAGLVLVASVAVGVAMVWGVSGVTDARAAARTTPSFSSPATSTTVAPAPATPVAPVTTTTTTAPVPVATTTTTTTVVPTTVPAPVAAAAPVAAPVPATSSAADVAALVARVESSGIAPGPTWSWSLGDTSRCGAIPGANNIGTGCTSGAAGAVTTVFAGSPALALVAHEVANAETENYAVPALVNLVVRDGGSASWSPIDAVASCLVVHYLGFQDGAAGPWACPASLADTVAANIHNAAFAG